VSNVADFQKPERVSKRLSRMGICSRRVAEKLIEQGMVQVDGKIIKENVSVTNANLLQVSARSGIYTPVKENTRIWLFNKPQNLVTTHFDPQGRITVFDRLKDLGLNIPHVLSVGRLDYLSEGLLIITNDGDLARALELPSYRLERQYRVRVFGRMFNEEKL
jgi:23S rRNA pseudouridine2605 synthase